MSIRDAINLASDAAKNGTRVARVKIGERVARVRVPANATPEQAVQIAKANAPQEKPTSFWQGMGESLTDAGANALTLMTRTNPFTNIYDNVVEVTGVGLPQLRKMGDTIKDVSKRASAQSRYRGSTAGRITGDIIATLPLIPAGGGPVAQGVLAGGMLSKDVNDPKQLAKDATIGGLFGKAGDLVGRGVGRVIGGSNVDDGVRLLADEGVTLTPGQRGGKFANFIEDQFLGSIPFVKDIPQAARARGANDLRVAVANRVLKPIGANVPRGTHIGREAIGGLQGTVNNAYDDAISTLSMQADDVLTNGLDDAIAGADREIGQAGADQLSAYAAHLKDRLSNGLSGESLKNEIQALRKVASNTAKDNNLMSERFWRIHDVLDNALTRQSGDGATAYRAARESQTLLRRMEDAASKSVDGEFGPTQLLQAAKRKGYGTSTANIASGEARLMDLADAAAGVMRNTTANSGTVPRAIAAGGLLGTGGAGASAVGMVDPTLATIMLGSTLGGYIPGVDRVLQNAMLNRPQAAQTFGQWISRNAPYLAAPGAAGAVGILGQ